MTTAIGQFRHVVALVVPGAATPDPDGGWGGGDAWVPLAPPTWHCSIQAASLRDLQRLSGGVLSTTATHVLRGRYHPQLTRSTRIYFGARVFDVESVHDQDERRIEHEVIAHEQLGEQVPGPPPVPYADQVRADGAVQYWRLDDRGGTTAVDVIGWAHGTISGGVTLKQPGALMDGNAAMAFDGTTGMVTAANALNCGPATQSFSVEAWVKGAFASLMSVVNKGPYPFNNLQTGWILTFESGSWQFYRNAGLGTPAGRLTFLNTVAPNSWAHIVVTYEAPTHVASGYVNGVLGNAQTFVSPAIESYTDTHPVVIGNSVYGTGAVVVDEVALYPSVLTAAQIAAHYAARNGT